MIVDGIPLNNAIYRSGHLQSSATINPFFIESIKLISGPASVSYGNGAMGGALLFNTKQTINKTSFLSRQQFESSSSSVINNFQATYYKKKFFHITAFSLKSAKNLTMGSNRIHDYEDWGNERIATNKNEQLYTGYTQGDFMHKTKYAITKKSSLLFNTQYSRSSKIYRFDKMNDIKNDTAKYKHWYYGPQIRFFQSIDYTTKYKTIAFEKIKTTLSFQNLQESRHKQLIEDTLLNNRKENVRVFDFNLDLSKKNHAIDFSYGLGVRAQKVVSKASLTNNSDIFYNTTRYPDNGSEVQDFFTYSQMGLTLNKKTDLLIGLRFNHSNLNANFNNFIFQEINNKNNSFVKSLILFYKPIKSTVLSASYYSGFRNPNIDDIGKLFSKDGLNVVVPNADLKPEYVNNFELSFNYILNPLKIQVQIFNSHITNAINREYGLFNGSDSILYDGEIMRVQMNKNITQANINGVHFSVDFNANDYLLMQGSCNYLSGLKNDSIPLSHIPPLNAKFSIDYKIRNHTFNFYTNYNSWKNIEDYDDLGVDNIGEATEDGNPSWYTLNLGYSRKIDKNISFSCCIKNLLNVHYKTFASGISASGRNFVLSIDSTF